MNLKRVKYDYVFSLLTIEDILEFLKNEWDYKGMTFDDFIERSFIKWLK
jgi:hypothetical protein